MSAIRFSILQGTDCMVTVPVDKCTTVANLREAFERQVPLPLGPYALLYQGVPMLPDTPLSTYNNLEYAVTVVRARLLPAQRPYCVSFTHDEATTLVAAPASVQVSVDITGFLASVRIHQTFVNDAASEGSAAYNFPVDPKAAVYDLQVTASGRTMKAEVMERTAAAAKYTSAVRAGHGAYLAQESAASADVYTFALGNVAAKATITVCLSYVVEMPLEALGEEGGSAPSPACRFQLPAAIAPRYASLAGLGSVDLGVLADAGAPTPYPVTLTINTDAAAEPVFVSHPSTVAGADNRTVISVVDGLQADFVMLLRVPAADVPTVAYERDSTTTTAMVTVYPPAIGEALRQPAEYVFVIDCSGSMDGVRIQHAREALTLCLRSIPVGSRFQVVKFGDAYAPCFPDGAMEYNNDTLERADAFVARLRADMGGTELYDCLRSVLSGAVAAANLCNVFLFTDGSVLNTRAVVALCASGTARVFTFGIGAAASLALVKGVAEATDASWEMLGERERLEPKVMRQFARAAAPAVTGLTVAWPAGCVQAFPTAASARVLYSGTRMLLYGVFTAVAPGTVTVSVAGKPLWAAPFNAAAAREGKALQAMAVKARLTQLEGAKEEVDAAKALAVALSVRYGVACKYTSLIAVETRGHARITYDLHGPPQPMPPVYHYDNAAAAFNLFAEPPTLSAQRRGLQYKRPGPIEVQAGKAECSPTRSSGRFGAFFKRMFTLQAARREEEEDRDDEDFGKHVDGHVCRESAQTTGRKKESVESEEDDLGRQPGLQSLYGEDEEGYEEGYKQAMCCDPSPTALAATAHGRMQQLILLQCADGRWAYNLPLHLALHAPRDAQITPDDVGMTVLVLRYMRTQFTAAMLAEQVDALNRGEAWLAKTEAAAWTAARQPQALVARQRADGSWAFNQRLYVNLLSTLPPYVTMSRIVDALDAVDAQDAAGAGDAEMTAIVLQHIRTHHASAALGELHLALAKGNAWRRAV